jgi:hypothetical protein
VFKVGFEFIYVQYEYSELKVDTHKLEDFYVKGRVVQLFGFQGYE